MGEKWITSIGLDIGTSTTKFIVSRLLVSETGNCYSLPSCQIIERQVSYCSPIHTTPLKTNIEIEVSRLAEILESEYKLSQINMKDVKAGAVIITGETARKENAEAIIHFLADRAGDFVVATAGADLEGILAGKGSGASVRSQSIEGVVANVDIGGGTANVALFQKGRAVQTVTFHVGGRLIRLKEGGEVTYISEFLLPWLHANKFNLQSGDTISYGELEEICKRMKDGMLSFLSGSPRYFADLLLLEPMKTKLLPIEEIVISGGVGQMMMTEKPTSIKNVTKYGDIGPLLAYSFTRGMSEYPFIFTEAKETTRATVIGAGMQNTEVSGSTIYVNEKELPIKNVPIMPIKVGKNGQWDQEDFQKRIKDLFQQADRLYDTEKNPAFAIALSSIPYCTYKMLQGIAVSIVEPFQAIFPQSETLVVLCEIDIAKALGQALAKHGKGHLEIICVDQIDFTYGDYIDLGLPVAGESISISVKTLAF